MTHARKIKETGLLMKPFLADAVRAGRKTQTRRVMNPQPDAWIRGSVGTGVPKKITTKKPGKNRSIWQEDDGTCYDTIVCPYGQPGDRLYLKEAFCLVLYDHAADLCEGMDSLFVHKSSVHPDWMEYAKERYGYKWTSPLFMPKVAARTWMEIEAVWPERLQDISESDAIAEGVESFRPVPGDGPAETLWKNYKTEKFTFRTARESFFSLWEYVNGPDSLSANPWNWAIKLKTF